MKKRYVLLAAGLLSTTLMAAELYVAPNGSGTAPYDSWGSASKTLTEALASAQAGDTIHLVAGVYSRASGETFPIAIDGLSDVTIAGATDGETVLDASGEMARGLHISNSSGITLRDLTITGAYLEGTTSAEVSGVGALVETSENVTFDRCEVIGNRVKTLKAQINACGIGVNIVDSSVTIQGSKVSDNKGFICNDRRTDGGPYGMGVSVGANSTVAVIDTVFSHNKRTDFDPQYTVHGGAISVMEQSASAALTNCLVYANDAAHGACHVKQGTLQLDSCTIADNIGVGAMNEKGTLSIRNSILYRNAGDLDGEASVVSCLIEDGDYESLTADPMF